MSIFGGAIDRKRPRTLHAELLGGVTLLANRERHPRERYRILEAYYHSTGVYDDLARMLADVDLKSVRALRNPAHAVVEFYAATMFPGADLDEAMPIVTENPKLPDAIRRIWDWSNMAANKQVLPRWESLYGDAFLKVATRSDDRTGQVRRVFQQPIKPEYVSEFETDERGFFTYVRLDIPKVRRNGDEFEPYTHTEVWDKPGDSFRVWEHDRGEDTPVSQLGTPTRETAITSFGFDFIPMAHAKFQDIGEGRGQSALMSGIEAIDEANRMATRLHQLLFRHNRPVWALEANAVDKDGLPLPPPLARPDGSDGDVLELGDDQMIGLPGNAKLVPLIPDVRYEAMLEALNAHLERMAAYHFPELRYYEISDRDLSGRAIQFLLAGAVDRVREARGNLERAIVRANEMALTIAQIHNLPGFSATELSGTWESGAFAHSIAERGVLPVNEVDEAEIAYKRAQTQLIKAQYGYPRTRLWREDGLDDEDIAEMLRDSEAESQSIADAMLRQFDRE